MIPAQFIKNFKLYLLTPKPINYKQKTYNVNQEPYKKEVKQILNMKRYLYI